MDGPALFSAASLPLPGAATPRWRPGLPAALHSEIFAYGGEGAGAGAAIAFALDALRAGRVTIKAGEDAAPPMLLWVQDDASIRLTGRPYAPGLPREIRESLIHVEAGRPEDVLFALEEGLRCRHLACVVGEIAGNPKALDFTASRRLSLTAEKHGVPLFIVRHDAQPDLSSARMRWRLRSAVSPEPRWNPQAPGIPSWRAELFRARAHPQGQWILRDDGQSLAAAPDHGDLASPAGAGSVAAG